VKVEGDLGKTLILTCWSDRGNLGHRRQKSKRAVSGSPIFQQQEEDLPQARQASAHRRQASSHALQHAWWAACLPHSSAHFWQAAAHNLQSSWCSAEPRAMN